MRAGTMNLVPLQLYNFSLAAARNEITPRLQIIVWHKAAPWLWIIVTLNLTGIDSAREFAVRWSMCPSRYGAVQARFRS